MTSDYVRVEPVQLRAIADELDTRANRIEQHLEITAERINQLLQGAGFVGRLAAALGTRYSQTQATMEAWPDNFRLFASLLRDASDRFEAADRATSGLVSGLSTTADLSMNYISVANRSAYDQLMALQQELQQATQALDVLQGDRAEALSQLQALRERLADYNGVEGDNILDFLGDGWEWLATRLDGRYDSTQSLIAALETRISDLDGQITAGQAQIAQLSTDIAGLQDRLGPVTLGPEADLNAIRQLEQSSGTPDWLKAQTGGCVRHILERMPIPQKMARDAQLWDDMARANPQFGIQIGDKPLEGSVIVMEGAHPYADDTHGHVMYVDHLDQGEVYVTDNRHGTPVRLSSLTSDTSGPNFSYLYFPWHTKI